MFIEMKRKVALKRKSIFFVMGCLLLLAGCGKQTKQVEVSSSAQYFRLTDTLGMVRADVLDPQNEGKLLARYYLVQDPPRPSLQREGVGEIHSSKDTNSSPSLPGFQQERTPKIKDSSRSPQATRTEVVLGRDGENSVVFIPVPLRRVATTSATHVGFLHALGVLDSVVAMSNPEWVYNRPSHAVANIGEDINIAMEPLLLSKPDVLFASSYGQNSQQIARVAEAGIPVVYLAEWQEQHPLARAEWLRFVAAFFGKTALADSILVEVRRAYQELQDPPQHRTPSNSPYKGGGNKKLPSSIDTIYPPSLCRDGRGGSSPSIMSGASYRGTWYVPSGTTYMGCLFRDAGAAYTFADERTNGSIPLTMEQALRAFSEADVWVGANARTMDELRAIDEHHTWFKAYQTGRVYHFYHRTNSTGGNDFWETGVVHPEIILRDLQWALYPDLYPDYEPYFIGRVQ
ncbi:MAG: ABC transporter substrate-binding protein [Paludibacteraceae bacterium]|nr:ABC transporter substrate-binding protein [Paludibacteraceae bacterium]